MQNKLKIKKGDQVIVVAGKERYKDDKERIGKVLSVDPVNQMVVVEDLNKVTKHSKPTAESPQGGIIQMEAPIHISNVMLIDPKSGKPTRVGRKKDKDGKLVRYAKSTGDIIKS